MLPDDRSASADRLLALVTSPVLLDADPSIGGGLLTVAIGGLAGAFGFDLSITGVACVIFCSEVADLGAAPTAFPLSFWGVSPVFIVIVVNASVTPSTFAGVLLYFLSLRLFFCDASSESGRSSSLTKSKMSSGCLTCGDDGLCRAGLGITVFLCELVAVEFGPVMSAEPLLRAGFAVGSFLGLLAAAGLPA